ncbi:helix-turn-helix domain-containing protein [Lysinibacillus xylanilyticus]|uniref:Helix-turn-helix domain-containing protein n=1 Tax=Lysinibacillus xylanilyticus TaxID=582475 RepID=A0ABV3W5A7_9BACI
MLNEFGQVIRKLRTKKGIRLNDFANRIDVSSAYLSNLETGKTETINLGLLEKIQEELSIFPMDNFETEKENSEFGYRLSRMAKLLIHLHNDNKQHAEYLLGVIEQGID